MKRPELACVARLRAAVKSIMVGQERVVDGVLASLLAGGHVLLEGPPGTGKTLLVKALAAALKTSFRRIQMTPDLMPSDLIGTSIWDVQTGQFRFVAGPVFTNLLLADELNRAPAKTQSALLECMAERQVTVEGRRGKLPDLFLVLATQNPFDQEGTYRLPEAQLDRFMVRIPLGFPSAAEELRLLDLHEEGRAPADSVGAALEPVATEAEVLAAREAVKAVAMSPELRAYVNDLVRATRENDSLAVGAGPRATLDLFKASKAWAALDGRDYVLPDDVKALYVPVVGHRVLLSAEAETGGVPVDEILREIVAARVVPR